jgi:sirohydrochlorin cobaltochelatase
MADLDHSLKNAHRLAGLASDAGVLLVGHGTRDAVGQAELFRAAQMLRDALRPRAVEACFLELAEPSIAAGVSALAARGAKSLIVLPALLFEAGHAKRDIPQQVAAAVSQQREPPAWSMAPPLDCHEQILELSARRFREALAAHGDIDSAQTLLVLVGRGTTDAAAIDRMREFTRLRAQRTPVGESLACFLTGNTPTLDEALAVAAASPWRNIVVQPHLLFHGQLIGDIAKAVAKYADAESLANASIPGANKKSWITPAHLGAEPELIAALGQRAGHSGSRPGERL